MFNNTDSNHVSLFNDVQFQQEMFEFSNKILYSFISKELF